MTRAARTPRCGRFLVCGPIRPSLLRSNLKVLKVYLMSSNEDLAEQYTANFDTCFDTAKQVEGPNKYAASREARKVAKMYRLAASHWRFAASAAANGNDAIAEREAKDAAEWQARADQQRAAL